MRLTTSLGSAALLALISTIALADPTPAPPAAAPSPAAAPANAAAEKSKDVLGNMARSRLRAAS